MTGVTKKFELRIHRFRPFHEADLKARIVIIRRIERYTMAGISNGQNFSYIFIEKVVVGPSCIPVTI